MVGLVEEAGGGNRNGRTDRAAGKVDRLESTSCGGMIRIRFGGSAPGVGTSQSRAPGTPLSEARLGVGGWCVKQARGARSGTDSHGVRAESSLEASARAHNVDGAASRSPARCPISPVRGVHALLRGSPASLIPIIRTSKSLNRFAARAAELCATFVGQAREIA